MSIPINPLMDHSGLPRFSEVHAGHVIPAIRELLADAEREIVAVEQDTGVDWDSIMEPLARLVFPLEISWGMVGHLHSVSNTVDLRESYEEMLAEMVRFDLRFKQSRPIYDRILALRESSVWDELCEAQQRIIESRLREAQLSGVALDGEEKERFNEISERLSELTNLFSNNVLDEVADWALDLVLPEDVEGLPETVKQLASQNHNKFFKKRESVSTPEEGPWRVTLELPSYIPFMQFCKNRELRKCVYEAYVTRAATPIRDNTEIADQILALRHEEARLLGFENAAELSLSCKMAPDITAVEKMFEELLEASMEPARRDLEEINLLAAESGAPTPLLHWDISYWSERLREQRLGFTDEELRPYFPMDHVLEGLFGLAKWLFGITIRRVEEGISTWHPDVQYFDVFDEQDELIAGFYLDPFSRPENKRGGAWMNDCRCRRYLDGKLLVPVAHLVCNGTPPLGERPALMTFNEVETLFHEFGHGLHHMLTQVDYVAAAGINNVEWDAVELPSQFMENWCYHRPTLMGMSKHFETGEPLPEEMFQKLRDSRQFRAASAMLRQLSFGMIDMDLHARFDPASERSIHQRNQEIQRMTSVLDPFPEDRSLCAFTHIFSGGYAAGYYSYKWSEILSADAFAAFEEIGLDDDEAVAELGRRFRDTVLAVGGGRHPMDVFRDFRGRDPEVKALLRHSGLA